MFSHLRFIAFLMIIVLPFCGNKTNAQSLYPPDHIVVVIEENYAYSQIMGSSYAPYINSIAADTAYAAVFTQFYAIEHPSQPNYFDLFAGCNQGCFDDYVPTTYPYTTDNMGAELFAAGKTFVSYSEDLPGVGFDGASYTSGGANYVRKHNPCTDWVGTGTNQFPSTVNQPYTSFPSVANYHTLPTVSYVIPNMYNDMHDGTWPSNITLGDNWMHNHMDSFKNWCLLHNSLLIFTFDEDDDLHGNNIATIFYGPMVRGGTYSTHEDLYSLLRTIEDMYGLGHACNAATATPINYCWRFGVEVNSIQNAMNSFTVSPNPANNLITISTNKIIENNLEITIFDVLGRGVASYSVSGNHLDINTVDYKQGVYSFKISSSNNLLQAGRFSIVH